MAAPARHEEDAPSVSALRDGGMPLLTKELLEVDPILSREERRVGPRRELRQGRARDAAHPQAAGAGHEAGHLLRHRGAAQEPKLIWLHLAQHPVDDAQPLHHFEADTKSLADREQIRQPDVAVREIGLVRSSLPPAGDEALRQRFELSRVDGVGFLVVVVHGDRGGKGRGVHELAGAQHGHLMVLDQALDRAGHGPPVPVGIGEKGSTHHGPTKLADAPGRLGDEEEPEH